MKYEELPIIFQSDGAIKDEIDDSDWDKILKEIEDDD